MASYFFDTSALSKHYHPEQGTAEVDRILNEQGSRYILSRLLVVEIQSAFASKVRTQVITMQDLQLLQKRFTNDLNTRRFQTIRMLQGHFSEAAQLLRKYAPVQSLRTLDALQLSVALDMSRKGLVDHFVCADEKLCKVAQAEGLSVINPT
jgi:predicted nucleic acid-binding protein